MFNSSILSLVVVLMICGCDQATEPQAVPSRAALPANLFEAPVGKPVSVLEARQNAKAGDEVTIQGVIGGRAKPFAQDRALFTLMDDSLETCTAEGDTCATPWDACCEPSEDIATASISVQVVDETGRPIASGLQGKSGLEPLAKVTVTGVYQPSPDGKAAAIQAKRIAVTQ